MTNSRLSGKVALVSGSGRGIGRAVALKLVAEGAKVVVNDLDRDIAEQVVAEIKTGGGDAVACWGNVTAPDFADRFVKTAVDAYRAQATRKSDLERTELAKTKTGVFTGGHAINPANGHTLQQIAILTVNWTGQNNNQDNLSLQFAARGLDFNDAPEPATLGLSGGALALVAWFAGRRRFSRNR